MAKAVRIISYLNKEYRLALSLEQSLALACLNKISGNLTVWESLREKP